MTTKTRASDMAASRAKQQLLWNELFQIMGITQPRRVADRLRLVIRELTSIRGGITQGNGYTG